MSYNQFKNPEQVKHLDDVMNKLMEVKRLYASIKNKNIRNDVKEDFNRLYDNLLAEKKSHIKLEYASK